MTAIEAAARGIGHWVDFYTQGLDPQTAAERREEILRDVHDQIAWSSEAGDDDAAVVRALRSRAVRGALSDVTWAFGATWRVATPGIEHPLRLALAAITVGLLAFGTFALARRQFSDDPAGALTLFAGVILAAGALALLARTRTRALGALWVVAATQIVLNHGVTYFAASTTILAHAVTSYGWVQNIAIANLGISVICLTAAGWWTTAKRAVAR